MLISEGTNSFINKNPKSGYCKLDVWKMNNGTDPRYNVEINIM